MKELIIVLLPIWVLSGLSCGIACFIGIFYNVLEFITKREYPSLYVVSNTLWIVGIIPFAVIGGFFFIGGLIVRFLI